MTRRHCRLDLASHRLLDGDGESVSITEMDFQVLKLFAENPGRTLSRDQILQATRQLLALMIRRNGIESADVASALFTVTNDLEAEFPALAARQLGWLEVPLLCGYEVSVCGSLPMCIRVLMHWNTDKTQSQIHHVYLHGAEKLRPDLSSLPPVDFVERSAYRRTM